MLLLDNDALFIIGAAGLEGVIEETLGVAVDEWRRLSEASFVFRSARKKASWRYDGLESARIEVLLDRVRKVFQPASQDLEAAEELINAGANADMDVGERNLLKVLLADPSYDCLVTNDERFLRGLIRKREDILDQLGAGSVSSFRAILLRGINRGVNVVEMVCRAPRRDKGLSACFSEQVCESADRVSARHALSSYVRNVYGDCPHIAFLPLS